MRLTHELLNKTGETTTVSSATIYPQGHDDEAGLIQVSNTSAAAGSTLTLEVYGRLGDAHLWSEVYDSGVVNGNDVSASATIEIYPQMYVKVTPGSGDTIDYVVSLQE